MSVFAMWLWLLLWRRSASSNGCSENFAPHAMTVATNLCPECQVKKRGGGRMTRQDARGMQRFVRIILYGALL